MPVAPSVFVHLGCVLESASQATRVVSVTPVTPLVVCWARGIPHNILKLSGVGRYIAFVWLYVLWLQSQGRGYV